MFASFGNRDHTMCSSNAYSAVPLCCSDLNGTLQQITMECDAECCQKFGLPDRSNCPKTGWMSVPWCALPKTMNSTDWKACFTGYTRHLNSTNGTGVASCREIGAAFRAQWSSVLLLVTIAATGALYGI